MGKSSAKWYNWVMNHPKTSTILLVLNVGNGRMIHNNVLLIVIQFPHARPFPAFSTGKFRSQEDLTHRRAVAVIHPCWLMIIEDHTTLYILGIIGIQERGIPTKTNQEWNDKGILNCEDVRRADFAVDQLWSLWPTRLMAWPCWAGPVWRPKIQR